jgi:hypothetical protein
MARIFLPGKGKEALQIWRIPALYFSFSVHGSLIFHHNRSCSENLEFFIGVAKDNSEPRCSLITNWSVLEGKNKMGELLDLQ